MNDTHYSFAIGLVVLAIPYGVLGWIDWSFATFMVSLACFILVHKMYTTKENK